MRRAWGFSTRADGDRRHRQPCVAGQGAGMVFVRPCPTPKSVCTPMQITGFFWCSRWDDSFSSGTIVGPFLAWRRVTNKKKGMCVPWWPGIHADSCWCYISQPCRVTSGPKTHKKHISTTKRVVGTVHTHVGREPTPTSHIHVLHPQNSHTRASCIYI